MAFKNLTFFTFPATVDFSDIEERLAENRLQQLGPLQASGGGFVSPFGGDSELMAHRIGKSIRIRLRRENRVIVQSAVDEAVAKRIEKIAAEEGREVGARERRRMSEDVIHGMLPNAPIRAREVDAHIDTGLRFIAVDTATRKTAEEFVSWLRTALGSLPALPANPRVTPSVVMTEWARRGELPEDLLLGEDCMLRDIADSAVRVTCRGVPMPSDEITRHIEAGKEVVRLGLSLGERVGFTIGEDMIVRRLSFADGVMVPDADAEDRAAQDDALYATLSGEVAAIYGILSHAFKWSRHED